MNDFVKNEVVRLTNGNLGALQCFLDLLDIQDKLMRYFPLGYSGVIRTLDSYKIYGTDIYVLWSDLCERDACMFIACLMAPKLGILSVETLQDACHRQDYSGRQIVQSKGILEEVRKKIPDFWS